MIITLLIALTLLSCSPSLPGEHIISYYRIGDKNVCVEEYKNKLLSAKQLQTRKKIHKFTFRNEKKIKRCPRENLALICKIQYLGFDEGYQKYLKDSHYKPARHERYAIAIGEPDRLEFFYNSKKYNEQTNILWHCKEPPSGFYKKYRYTAYWPTSHIIFLCSFPNEEQKKLYRWV